MHSALKLLYRDSGLQAEVAADVPAVEVTLRIRDKTLDEAVEAILEVLRGKDVQVAVERTEKIHRFALKK